MDYKALCRILIRRLRSLQEALDYAYDRMEEYRRKRDYAEKCSEDPDSTDSTWLAIEMKTALRDLERAHFERDALGEERALKQLKRLRELL